MICPRCSKVMAVFRGVSQASQLTRQDLVSAVEICGYRCWNCGEWREAVFVPVKEMPEREVVEPRYSPGLKSQAYLVVAKFFDSIADLRGKGSSWHTVAKLMAQAGYRCQEKTLQKYFLMEQAKRCGDEQTA